MNFSEFCIKRPVFSTVLSLILIIIGLMGLLNLATRFVPDFERNIVMIITNYPGASPNLIETDVTTPLEEEISSISGIDTIESDSYQGMSRIRVTLKFGQPLYEIANQIRNMVSMAQQNLPTGVQSPNVHVGYGDMDLMDIAFTSKDLSLQQIRDYLDRYITPQIEQVPGVSQVDAVGANAYAMQINLDPKKMAALGISANQVQNAIQNSNIELPAGQIQGNSINFPITAETKLSSAQEFNNIIVKNNGNRVVQIKDIGNAELGSDNSDLSLVKLNGEPGVFLSVQNTTDSNPLATAADIDKLLAQIQAQLPPDLHVNKFYDQSVFMKGSVHEVYEAIFFATLCVIGIIALFLGSWRTMLIPIVTIPICIMASFGVMYVCGFSINMITLLAVVLSIGLVVDDAIVMLENIYRHIENGMAPMKAAIQGSKEITFAVIAMTLTLAAVYAPIGLMKNQASGFFQSFAFTLAGTVIVSGFVALTLSPMMCARLLKPIKMESKRGYHHFLESFFARLQTLYSRYLRLILKNRVWVVLITLALIVGSFFLVSDIPAEFMPEEDLGIVIGIVNANSGANITMLEQSLEQVATVMGQSPAMALTVSMANTNPQAFSAVFGDLKPYKERTQSAAEIAAAADAKIKTIPGLSAGVFSPSFGGSMKSQLEFNLLGAGTYQDLYGTSQYVLKKLASYPGLQNMRSSLTFDNQQYSVTVNRDVAGRLGVSVKDIDNTLATFFGDSQISTFDMGGKTYDVYLQAIDSDLHNIDSINQFYVNNANNQLVSMSNLVQTQAFLGQQDLPHYNRARAVTIDAQLAPGYELGTVVKYLETALPQILPKDTKYAFTGRAQQLQETNNDMGWLFLLAIIFIYLVLAAQFESFLDPFIILLSVPFSMIGALISLRCVGGSLNIFTDIGLVTLIGLIAKHGILITQFANKLQEEGHKMQEALIQAATIRLRPILMTTMAMIFGALPLVFATGASANSRMQIGVVIIGGLFFGTFFSLILVPVTYSFADKIRRKFKR